jgi:hypothetical protein
MESKYVPVKLPPESQEHLATVRSWLAGQVTELLPAPTQSDAVRVALRLAAEQITAGKNLKKKEQDHLTA